MPNSKVVRNKGLLILLIALLLAAAMLTGAGTGFLASRGETGTFFVFSLALLAAIPFFAYVLYMKKILPYYRRLEDANLELHIKQEELLDVKDDLFIKFLGIYDVNHAANSHRLYEKRLKDVADITARVMEADACLIYLYNKKHDALVVAASNDQHQKASGKVRIPLGEGIEGWVGRRLEPVMLRNFRSDSRFHEFPGLDLAEYTSLYCLPLYVYSNSTLVGVMELLYTREKGFSDEEINFFTTLTGILSTTIQNEELQGELRKMNLELEQWVTEKTEELRASEERYRTLVESACESIFVLAENGDIVFANDQAARLTGVPKFKLIHKNLLELFVDPSQPKGILSEAFQGHESLRQGELKRADGTVVPVDVIAVGLRLMGKPFVQSVIHDTSSRARLEKLLAEKEQEIAALKAKVSL